MYVFIHGTGDEEDEAICITFLNDPPTNCVLFWWPALSYDVTILIVLISLVCMLWLFIFLVMKYRLLAKAFLMWEIGVAREGDFMHLR